MSEPMRPRDFALLLLGSGDLLPRQRARDQQADRAGLELMRRVLAALAALDPEPDQMEAALLEIVEELGQPFGPARAIARAVFEDWQSAARTPEWVAFMLDEAIRQES